MQKRDVIKAKFNQFVDYIEKMDSKSLSSMFESEVKGHISTVGQKDNAEEIVKGLIVNKDDLNVSRYLISNFVCHTDGNRARQSAYVMALVGKDDGKFLFSLEYGGKFLINWVRKDENSDWLIDEIWYDLDWVKGNTEYIKDWNLIDYGIYTGHTPMISSEYDSVWASIPENDEPMSDEELIKEDLFMYSFGLDNCDWTMNIASYTDDIKFCSGKHVMVSSAKALANSFKNTSHKESALQHAIKICKVEVNGDEAIIYGYRIEPHRLGTKVLHRNNVDANFYSATYTNNLRKVNGKWKMYNIDYGSKVFFDTNPRPTHYYDDIKG